MSASPSVDGASLVLYPVDFEVIMKLLPRANILVGDIPKIYQSLGRIEQAARSQQTFRVERLSLEQDAPAGADESEA